MSKIEYEIAKPGFVSVKVVDIIGTPVKTLVNTYKEAGKYFIDFSNEQLLPGQYYYKVILSDKPGTNGSSNNSGSIIEQGKVKIDN